MLGRTRRLQRRLTPSRLPRACRTIVSLERADEALSSDTSAYNHPSRRREKRAVVWETWGPVCGFLTLCGFPTDMQISYRWVYGFLIVGFRGIGWARLFYDLKTLLLYAAGHLPGLSNYLQITLRNMIMYIGVACSASGPYLKVAIVVGLET